ncbi:hypothetical protein [Erythrobacter sp. CCH5-A1]|jgi:hypothetical protein|uniref:hypothetical protein n=1 Tax=Erythrobacter sp. CCH5-A1 TaxID=1768792 RepID=UPI00082CA6AD|nr:hypothetical protein [Erythrobacter sp. CCH5-A1]
MRRLAGLLIALSFAAAAAAQDAPPRSTPEIIVRPPPTEAERHRELREFTRAVIRPPRLNHPVAKFAFPVCVTVLGLAPDDAAVIAERIRENAEALGVGADRSPTCVPTVRVAFMAPAAGPPESWLTAESPQLAHLAGYQKERVLGEAGPVRAWNKVSVRDALGNAFRPQLGDQQRFPTYTEIQPLSASDPIVTTEITGAAVLISRDAAHGFTLGQLADYATVRALLGTGPVEGDAPAPTILTLFSNPAPPVALTDYDRALVRELYDASRNAKPRRVYNDIARAAVAAERSDGRAKQAP